MLIEKFSKLKKDEMIEEYKRLNDEYEELEQQYNDLSDNYGELENKVSEDYTIEELKEESVCEFKEKFLKDIKFGTELQNRLVDTILKYADEQGIRFEILNHEVIAQDVINNLKSDLKLINKIADIIEEYV